MTEHILQMFAAYGLLLVFANVFLEQLGIPLPAVPTLVVGGALAASGVLPLVPLVGVAVVACLIADAVWFEGGRRFGSRVLSTLCRISLSPDSCVRRSSVWFERWQVGMLLVAKFIPGLSTIAPPMLGAMRIRWLTFIVYDLLGSLIWAGIAIGVGFLFAPAIDQLLASMQQAGTVAGIVVLALLACYIAMKWLQRQQLLRTLRMARITVDELRERLSSDQPPVVLDVRSRQDRLVDARALPNALLVDLAAPEDSLGDIGLDTEIVIYCRCPNEASAAFAAKKLMQHGYRQVRPLLGGLDAWSGAGYPVPPIAVSMGSPLTH
jgi:membrane protein DedA with SNARE-associated domain/rhodanese-related sulfurtransferase